MLFATFAIWKRKNRFNLKYACDNKITSTCQISITRWKKAQRIYFCRIVKFSRTLEMTFTHEWARIYILQVANLCQGKTCMWIHFTSTISIYPIQMQWIRDIQDARNSCSCVCVWVYVWIYPIRTYMCARIVTIDFHQECWWYINYIITNCSVIYG